MLHFRFLSQIIFGLVISHFCYGHTGETDLMGCHNAPLSSEIHCHFKSAVTSQINDENRRTSIYSYSWFVGDWGTCVGDCGAGNGLRQRYVYCLSSIFEIVSDENCNVLNKPISSESCMAKACPTYRWITGNWGECGGLCGVGMGTKMRSVDCLSSEGSLVASSYCDAGTKPNDSQSCTASICLLYGWTVSEWSDCFGDCGDGLGQKIRSVECHNSKGAIVSEDNCTAEKPVSFEACSRNECPSPASFNVFTGVAELPRLLMDSSVYQASLTLDQETSCFNVGDLTVIEEDVDEMTSQYSSITRLLNIPKINTSNSSINHLFLNATLEVNNQTGQLCVVNAFSGDFLPVSAEFNPGDWNYWIDVDSDCQDTEAEVLTKHNLEPMNNRTCRLESGRWYDWYGDDNVDDINLLEVDHIVPLSWAHSHGGANWSIRLKEQFANDEENLLPVSSSIKQNKAGRSLFEWLPDNNQCDYMERWINIVEKYHLCFTASEQIQMEAMRIDCLNR